MIILLAAVSKNGVIGAKNELPWYLPEDLKHFRELTAGHTVLMGRKTFESIMKRNGKPLPNRKNVVVTSQVDYAVPEGVAVFHSVDEALASLAGENVYVIGGGKIYKQTIDKADVLEITHVDQEVEGDVCFPKFSEKNWKLEKEEQHEGFRFATYKRSH